MDDDFLGWVAVCHWIAGVLILVQSASEKSWLYFAIGVACWAMAGYIVGLVAWEQKK